MSKILVWFNERAYRIQSPRGTSKFIYDFTQDITENALHLYHARWLVFNQAMDAVCELSDVFSDTEIILSTDSRLIEELKGEITPDSPYAKHSLRYFIENDYTKFRRVVFQKYTSTVINERICEQLNQDRS